MTKSAVSDARTGKKIENSDFILESKMAELNQNKNSKQRDRRDVEWKLYFILEINYLRIQFTYFLGHDGCLWKINLRILRNHAMKNFQVRHDQHDSIKLPKRFSLGGSK